MHRKSFFIGLLIFMFLINAVPGAAQDDSGPVTHVVQANENLYRIALRYNISVEALMQANGLTNADLVMVGATLIIPTGNSVPVAIAVNPTPATGTHTVAAGETLLQIARRYGLTADDLIRANNIVNPSLITVGQVLTVPGSTRTSAANNTNNTNNTNDTNNTEDDDLGIVGVTVEFTAPPPVPDLGILPAGSAPPPTPETEIVITEREVMVIEVQPESAPPEIEPFTETTPPENTELVFDQSVAENTAPGAPDDLGILSPDIASWVLQPGIFTIGDAKVVREIFQRGQALGNNPHAFSKIGDCNSELPFFLGKFDQGTYNLGPYAYLQPVIEQFAGSFGRKSLAVWTGNHAWAVLDATWSNPAYCLPGETPIACEFRVNRPSLVLVRLGTNESGSPDLFETNLRRIIDFSIEQGVIPVLGTKADHLEGSDRNNDIVRALAEEYGVPLWDFGRVADSLPAHGLLADGFHMNYVPPDYTTSAALQSGHSVQNLMALIALDTVWRSALY